MYPSITAHHLVFALLTPGAILPAIAPAEAAPQEAQVPPEVKAQQKALVPDRPGFGDNPNPVPAGFFLLEAGYNLMRDNSEDTDSAPELLLRAGLTPRLELRAGWDGYQWDGDDGALNTRVGVKFDALDQHGLVPDLGIVVEVALPTGDDQVASSKVEPEVRFAGGYELTDSLSVSGNLNFAERQSQASEARFFEFAGSFNVGLNITDSLGSYVEYFGTLPNDPASYDTHSVGAGLTYVVGGILQLDVFTNAGLDSDADGLAPGAGIAFVW